MVIEKANVSNIDLIPKEMDLDIVGRMILNFNGAEWQYKEEYDNAAKIKSFPTSKPLSIDEFNDNRYGFIYREDNTYIGHAVVEKRFNNTLYIEDFDIHKNYRKRGLAYNLMDEIIKDAKSKEMKGISLEVQDTNVIAAKFYIKYGFVIGGFDNLFYQKTRQKGENAIYLYFLFDEE